MDKSKRGFLKIASCSVLGALSTAWARSGSAVGQGKGTETLAGALKAKKWGMVVDMKKCLQKDGCTACIDACHKVHNVPQIENSEEEVKWIWKEKYENTFPNHAHKYTEKTLKDKPVLVLCNHCESPPCVRVCPTQATFKKESDGIVMMDQHRCIGCRYCIVACPYGSRSFNWSDPRQALGDEIDPGFPTRTKGVVEKCNFCAERLARGEVPACVEACHQTAGTGALLFGDLEDPNSEISIALSNKHSIQRKPELGTAPQIYYLT